MSLIKYLQNFFKYELVIAFDFRILNMIFIHNSLLPAAQLYLSIIHFVRLQFCKSFFVTTTELITLLSLSFFLYPNPNSQFIFLARSIYAVLWKISPCLFHALWCSYTTLNKNAQWPARNQGKVKLTLKHTG